MQAELETLVLPGVEQDPRAHYIDYTRATDWEETVATLEDRLRDGLIVLHAEVVNCVRLVAKLAEQVVDVLSILTSAKLRCRPPGFPPELFRKAMARPCIAPHASKTCILLENVV